MSDTDSQKSRLAPKISLSLLVMITLACNWLPIVDRLAQDYLAVTIENNVIVFGIVRSLNAVISVVQSAEVGVGVAGIGLGEIFDPLNDLIERFSGLLLITLTALGLQQVMLLFTASLALKISFSVLAVMALMLIWWPRHWNHSALKLFLAILLVRFLLSIEVALVWLFDVMYFNTTGQEALTILEASAHVIDSIKDSLTDIDLGKMIFGDRAPKLESEDITTTISTSVVTLIVGMLIKSLLIPIGTLWAGYKLLQRIFR